MTPSPCERLAQALQNVTDIARCAHRAGITPREFANAQVARPCSTIPFLRICVAIQHDPMPSLPHSMPKKPSDFDFGFFSMAFRMKRAMNGHDEAQAAAAIGFQAATIRRIERADALLIGVVLKVCKYLELHCFSYLSVTDTPAISKKIEAKSHLSIRRPHVSRETSLKIPDDMKPLAVLVRKRGHELRRAEMTGRALERLEGTPEYWSAFNRHQRYLASVANLTLAIEAVRREEGKEVKVLGSLAT
jgi:hypothetical protein